VAVGAFAVAKLSLQWVAKRGTEALLRYDDPKLLRAGVYRALGKARGGFLGDNDEKANIGRDLASYELEYSTLQGGVASLPSVVISLVTTVTTEFVKIAETERNSEISQIFSDIFFGFFTLTFLS